MKCACKTFSVYYISIPYCTGGRKMVLGGGGTI